jgi:hypothetical protein
MNPEMCLPNDSCEVHWFQDFLEFEVLLFPFLQLMLALPAHSRCLMLPEKKIYFGQTEQELLEVL